MKTGKAEQPLRILLLEDNPGDARLIQELLKETAENLFLVQNVTTFAQAVEVLASSPFDVLLLDLTLPDSSGLETYRSVRSRFPEIPIIIFSGNTDETTAITAVREGAQDYLVKGQIDGPALVRCIRYGIERKEFEKKIDQMRSQHQHSAKMAALGEMAGGVAHEINTPLGAILLTVSSLRTMIQPLAEAENNKETMLQMVDLVEQTTHRIATIVKSLRAFSKDSSDTPFMDAEVQSLVESAISLCSEKFGHLGITLDLNTSSFNGISIQCRESEIIQVLLSLLNNSRDAVEHFQEKWVKVSCKDLGKDVAFTIEDSGNGIPKEIVEKIFNPFFTSKDIGKGTGLGLSISKGIVDSHGGSIYVDETSKHTTFVVRLPKVQSITLDDSLLKVS